MSRIKSFDELKKIRDSVEQRIDIRKTGESEDKTTLAVGMATCGIAAGARKTLMAIVDEINEQGLKNIAVIQTGCLGYCYAEPIVEVRAPGQEPILYGDVDDKRGREIVNKHLKRGELLDDSIIGKGFEKA
ncbi:MAG TPA: (2Fe-2S) ferredoxin domain-containing protein [Clostridia bacterium]|nr:(2Fe-2S) ferredoxin domain-containing protein [Clostridia bacterium]